MSIVRAVAVHGVESLKKTVAAVVLVGIVLLDYAESMRLVASPHSMTQAYPDEYKHHQYYSGHHRYSSAPSGKSYPGGRQKNSLVPDSQASQAATVATTNNAVDTTGQSGKRLDESEIEALLGEISNPEALMKLVELTGGGPDESDADGSKKRKSSPFADFAELSSSKSENSTRKNSEERRVLRDFLMKSLWPRWASIMGLDPGNGKSGPSASPSASPSSRSEESETVESDSTPLASTQQDRNSGGEAFSKGKTSTSSREKEYSQSPASASSDAANNNRFQLMGEAFPDFHDVVDRMQSMLTKLKQFSAKQRRQIPKIVVLPPSSYWSKLMRRMRNNLGFSEGASGGQQHGIVDGGLSSSGASSIIGPNDDSVSKQSLGNAGSTSSQKGSSINGGNKSKRKHNRVRHRQHPHVQQDLYKSQQTLSNGAPSSGLSNPQVLYPYYQPTAYSAAAYGSAPGDASVVSGSVYPAATGSTAVGGALTTDPQQTSYNHQQSHLYPQQQDATLSSPYVYPNQDYYAYNNDDPSLTNGVYYSTAAAANQGNGLEYAAAYYPDQYQTYYTFVEASKASENPTGYGKIDVSRDANQQSWDADSSTTSVLATPYVDGTPTAPSSPVASASEKTGKSSSGSSSSSNNNKEISDRDQSATTKTGSTHHKKSRANTLFDYVPALAQLKPSEGAHFQRTWLDRAETVLANVFDVDYHVRDVQSYLDSLWGMRRLRKRSASTEEEEDDDDDDQFGKQLDRELPQLGNNWQGNWLIRGDRVTAASGGSNKNVDSGSAEDGRRREDELDANDPCLTPGDLLLECKVHEYLHQWVRRNDPHLPSSFNIQHVSTMADELHQDLLKKVSSYSLNQQQKSP